MVDKAIVEGWVGLLPEPARSYIGDSLPVEVDCIIADIAGGARGKTMSADKFRPDGKVFLPDTILYQAVTGSYAGSAMSEDQYREVDVVLVPDMATATAAPWSGDVALQVIHDVQDQAGVPLPQLPRNVLRRVVGLYLEKGWRPIVAPELEFYLVARNADPNLPLKPMSGRTGRTPRSFQAYSISGVDEYGSIIDEIHDFANAQGLEIDTMTHEEGASQIEFNLRHGDPVLLADKVFHFKRLIREAALRHGCLATFMAKPMEGQPGSAMHIHHSVVDANTGRNVFSGPDGKPTDLFRHFIGGLQTFLPAATPFIAPYVNSYRRFVPGLSAPVNLEWGEDNRTTGIRIPVSTPEARRIENRVAGMDCNPYIGLAASLACGFLGLVRGLQPRNAATGVAYENGREIPTSLPQALELLDDAPELSDAMGRRFVDVYRMVKKVELSDFDRAISPWEREHLLMRV